MNSPQTSTSFNSFPFNRLEKLIVRTDLSVDERRKRAFLILFLLTTLPILFAFALWRLSVEESTDVPYLLILTMGIGIAVFIILRHAQQMLFTYRVGVLIILALLLYLLATGNSDGVAFIWFFFHPVAAFFLFGSREGLFWVVLSWIACFLIIILDVSPYTYQLTTGLRFMVSYTLVSILAYALEAARQYYYDQLAAEKLALEVAVQQVKTLQGLLPICASCKKIRDDQGYWHQVEIYVRTHTDVEFSHGICPDCLINLYPMVGKGQGDSSA